MTTPNYRVKINKSEVKATVTEVSLRVFSDVTQGPMGISAYQVALNNGFVGTQHEWLESLRLKAFQEDAEKILTNDGHDTFWMTIEDKLNQSELLWDLGEIT